MISIEVKKIREYFLLRCSVKRLLLCRLVQLTIILLIINISIIVLLCAARNNFDISSFLKYFFYAGDINILLGILTIVGAERGKAQNYFATRFINKKKTHFDIVQDNIKNYTKSTIVFISFELVGVILIFLSKV